MDDPPGRMRSCFICGEFIEEATGAAIDAPDPFLPRGWHRFFAHIACLKRVARPGDERLARL
jgi:hypothetical protein